jgi:hypothetical protein
VKNGNTAHHFVPDELQTESYVTAALGFVDGAHAFTDQFLAAVGTCENPDTKNDGGDSQEG